MVSTPDPGSINDDDFERDLVRNDLRVDPGRWGWSPGRVLGLIVVIAMSAFWVWAFIWSPRGHPDELDDPAYAEASEIRCATARTEIDAVPAAAEAVDPADRATQLQQTNGILRSMVADLRATAPSPETRDGELVEKWLADWDTYLDDRDRYRDRLSEGNDTIFEVTARDGDQITGLLDLFADINGMASCQSPGDV